MLPQDLIDRLKARAADPEARSDTLSALKFTNRLRGGEFGGPPTQRASLEEMTGDGALGGMMQKMMGSLFSGGGFNIQKMAEQVAEDMRQGKMSAEDVFGGAQPGAGTELYEGDGETQAPGDLPPPASDGDIAGAEAALGIALPENLKQLYTGIANGGFGPGDGLPSLAQLVARYREFRAEPQGPCGEMWPDHLLPVIPIEMGEICYDLKTGKITCWDREEFMDDESPEEELWDRSFVPRADSLALWLESWLAEKPPSEQMAEEHQNHLRQIVRTSIDALRSMTPEQRAEMGFPEKGWEDQVCRNHGLDPKDLRRLP